ncbi:MAG: hypothetical protein QOG84_2735, partial [Sphingomonadales bacterium]|nr:hypothetical protein [Sphingomonadales bacterium]
MDKVFAALALSGSLLPAMANAANTPDPASAPAANVEPAAVPASGEAPAAA